MNERVSLRFSVVCNVFRGERFSFASLCIGATAAFAVKNQNYHSTYCYWSAASHQPSGVSLISQFFLFHFAAISQKVEYDVLCAALNSVEQARFSVRPHIDHMRFSTEIRIFFFCSLLKFEMRRETTQLKKTYLYIYFGTDMQLHSPSSWRENNNYCFFWITKHTQQKKNERKQCIICVDAIIFFVCCFDDAGDNRTVSCRILKTGSHN